MWIALCLADGKMNQLCRRAIELLEKQFRGTSSAAVVSEALLWKLEIRVGEVNALETRIADEQEACCHAVLQEQYRTEIRNLQDLIASPVIEMDEEND